MDAKKKTLRATEQDAVARENWWQKARQWDIRDLLFLDECGVHLALTRRYSRSPQGQRAPGVVPRNKGKNTTILGALSWEGVQAAMSLEGATDQLAFEAFIEQVLVPTLRAGQIVILDNLSAHKSEKTRQLVEGAGCTLEFLPTYSPDFNPIEMLWSKFKSELATHAARTQHALDDLIWPLLRPIDFSFTKGWFEKAGYFVHSF